MALVITEACHNGKPTPVPLAPQPMAGARPQIQSFTVEPLTITAGQTASLHWSVSESDSIQIDQQVGEVEPAGKRSVSPGTTTTYKLTAKNAHGTAESTVTLTVSGDSGEGANSTDSSRIGAVELIGRQLRDLHFEYNQDVILPSEQHILTEDANALKSLLAADSQITVTIEGHCDERGSPEYNVALADRRATFVRDSLAKLGVPRDRLNIVSYGDERPVCVDATEQCYSKNRRAHFTYSH